MLRNKLQSKRTAGSKKKKTRQEINEESRELKRKRKRKGLPSGSRFNDASQGKNSKNQKPLADPRIGSKKPITLTTLDDSNNIMPSEIQVSNSQAKNGSPRFQHEADLSENELMDKNLTAEDKKRAEQELAQLESDSMLDQLLDMVENNKALTAEQTTYLNTKLDRLDELMAMLGYSDEDFEETTDAPKTDTALDTALEKKEDIVGLLKRK